MRIVNTKGGRCLTLTQQECWRILGLLTAVESQGIMDDSRGKPSLSCSFQADQKLCMSLDQGSQQPPVQDQITEEEPGN